MENLLQRFLTSSPEKYYNQEAYNTYFDFLSESLRKNEAELLNFLTDKEEAINISYKLLETINDKPIHECQVKDTDATFIDEYINYNYLQLLDGVLLIYIQLATYIQLANENKQTENLDLYTCIGKLSKTRFNYLLPVYEHTVRNGIGHGKIIYWESKADYIDKKNNKSTLYYYQFIRKFDLLLDIVNGFTLAYLAFWHKKLRLRKVNMPRQMLFQEIKLNNTLPTWKVLSVIDQQVLEKKQLAINVNSFCSSQVELRDEAIKTAVHASHLASGRFDEIYLHITHNGYHGYVKFDTKALNSIEGAISSDDFIPAVTDSLEWFFHGFVENMPASMDSNAFVYNVNPANRLDNEELIDAFLYKDIYQYVNSYNDYMLIKDARYVYSGVERDKKRIINLIKASLPKLLAHTRRKSKELNMVNKHPQIPIKYICISVYEDNKRGRALRSNGIKPNLICTIQYNATTTGSIKLMDSKIEHFQGVVFNWNHYWRNAEAYYRMFPEN
ncbi:hypothetical protein SAMN06265337_3484 [Hymenobacter gelipurpurascens]|uniref:Uncharacterized protein n=1 Tax=Hymenobacter gelipurpurascens TaxID=89968 RepID=A0A212UES3_9BACT|nr:hypothetical protein [Hymenobacter gelipurpurascens]SNC76631.1 hypothetical protein SAMN06265337_3484 [Hymenobacter gelipurpurascens]